MGIKHFLRGAALGALFASVTTLLVAPKAGKKTRADALQIAQKLSERLSRELDRAGVVSRGRYEAIVDETVREYAKGKKLASGLVSDLALVLNAYFKQAKKELSAIDWSGGGAQKKSPKKSPKKSHD